MKYERLMVGKESPQMKLLILSYLPMARGRGVGFLLVTVLLQ